MILNCKYWNKPLDVFGEKAYVLVFRDTDELFKFQKTLELELEEGLGEITLFDGVRAVNLEKSVLFLPMPLLLDFNSKKAITFLHKRITEEVNKQDLIFEFEELKEKLKDWLIKVRKSTFIDYSIKDEIELSGVLSLYGVKYHERDDSAIITLTKYLDLMNSLIKPKVVFISFSFYLFSTKEMEEFIIHFRMLGIIIIFIEKEKPKDPLDCSVEYIENGFFLGKEEV